MHWTIFVEVIMTNNTEVRNMETSIRDNVHSSSYGIANPSHQVSLPFCFEQLLFRWTIPSFGVASAIISF